MKVSIHELVESAVRAEGGKHSINIADGHEFTRHLLLILSDHGNEDVIELMDHYRKQRLPQIFDEESDGDHTTER